MGEWCPTMPPWVRRIPVGRGLELNVMARTILEGLWFCAPVSRGGEMFSGPVDLGRWTPTIPELAEANGVSEVSAGKALRTLISVGWVTRKGRGLVLAWQSPGEFAGLCTRSSRIACRIPEDRSTLEDRILEDRVQDPRVGPAGSSGKADSILEDRAQLTTPLPQTTQPPHVGDREPEQWSLIPPEADPPKRDLLADLRALHERLSIEAHRHHHPEGAGGRVRGRLPKSSTKLGKQLDARMRAALADHGFEVCEEILRWRAAEWRHDRSQLARPPTQTWAEGSIAFVLAKIDAGVAPPGSGPPDRGYELPPPGMQAHELEWEMM